MHRYTKEQTDFIKINVKNRGNKELTNMFNAHFGLNLKKSQIRAFKKNHKLSSGLDGKFKPGHVPANKGRKGVDGWEPTQFKKGHKPWNYMPIGSERVNGDGYVDIKIQDGKKQKNWKGKHIILWEKEYGPVPKGYAVIFGDGNKRNFEINNLISVSRKQLITLNKMGLIQKDADLTRSAIHVVNLHHKISSRRKK